VWEEPNRLRLSQGASLKPDESGGCYPVSEGTCKFHPVLESDSEEEEGEEDEEEEEEEEEEKPQKRSWR